MMDGKLKKLLVAVGIVALAYYLKTCTKTKFTIPKTSSANSDILFNITILGTNDLHSSFNGIGLSSYPDSITGGYSKLVELIDVIREQKKEEGEIVLTLDAGDWYTGSLFDNLAADERTSSIPQMEYFSTAHYDAIILGNHDFDEYENALYTILDKSHKLSLDITILASNLIPVADDSKFKRFIIDGESSVKILPYLIKETALGRVGVLGYVTPDALFVSTDYRSELQFIGYSPTEGEQYAALVQLARNQSTMLKTQYKCDVIVAVIHGGHKDGEDVQILNLPDINIVVGGHTHERYLYSMPDSSLTSQCGYAGMYLTALSVGLLNSGKLQYRGVDLEYREFVSETSPQCIKITNKFRQNQKFELKIRYWKKEINEFIDFDQDKIVHRGDLSGLFRNSETRPENAKLLCHIFADQYNKWEQIVNPGADPLYVVFWNKEFLEVDQFTHDSKDIILTYNDVYNLIFFTATKEIHTFYVKKEELYYTIQGVYLLQTLVSPLMTLIAGGILYDETDVYIGIPIITNIKTIQGVPYNEWPPLVKVMTNSISSRYFWKVAKFSYGIMNNLPRDRHGNPITIDESHVPNAPKEIELFMNYLKEINI